MKKQFKTIIFGSIIFAIVLAVGFSLLSGAVSPARADEDGPLVDGAPEDTNPLPAMSVEELSAIVSEERMITYSAFEFHPVDSGLTYAPYGSSMYAVSIPAGGMSFKLSLDLPNGVYITGITFYVIDDSASNMSLAFYYANPAAASQFPIGSVSSSGASPNVQGLSIVGAPYLTTVNNSQYSYYLRYAPTITGSTHRLVGAKVSYVVPLNATFLPAVLK